MAAKFVVFVALLALANAGKMRRETNGFEEIQKHAQEFQKTFTDQYNALVNSPNTQQAQNAIKQGSDSVLQQLSAFSNSLQAAITDANGKAKEALESTKQKIDQNVAELRRQHPDVEQQAVRLRDQIQSTVQSTVSETQKLAKEIAANADTTNQKLAPQIQKAFQDFTKQAQEVQKKLAEAINKQ